MVGSQSPAAGNGITQHITQHFTISGNGDAALKQAMQEAARQGRTMALNRRVRICFRIFLIEGRHVVC